MPKNMILLFGKFKNKEITYDLVKKNQSYFEWLYAAKKEEFLEAYPPDIFKKKRKKIKILKTKPNKLTILTKRLNWLVRDCTVSRYYSHNSPIPSLSNRICTCDQCIYAMDYLI